MFTTEGNPQHILVVNDTQDILLLFEEILTEAGYRVTTRSYGDNEMREVQEIGPDLIIADCPPMQREEQGWQFIQKLKMSPRTARIPIILCATNLRAVRENYGVLASKQVLVVPKPFELDELLCAVAHQLSHSPQLEMR